MVISSKKKTKITSLKENEWLELSAHLKSIEMNG